MFALSLREGLQLGHNYIGTEHLVLGLIREGEGVGAQVLVKLGADLRRVRARVIELLSDSAGGERAVEPVIAASARMTGPVWGSGGGSRRCSFCGRREESVAHLVAAREAYICDGCIAIAREAVAAVPPEPKLSVCDRWLARRVVGTVGPPMEERFRVVVVGGGQAGLAVSHELTELGVEHAVLERSRVAQTWRDRWDSFCLVTPNWSVQLPGGVYAGDDPDGFMPRDDVVGHLEGYASSFGAPVREGVEVVALDPAPQGRFRLATSVGALRADAVVLATGAYQRPHRPSGAATLPASVLQIDAEGYTNEASLPPGKVLVVGSGQTGCQLGEELNDAGREVWLACGRAPWCLRRIGGRDVISWAVETGSFDDTPADLPSPAARLGANIQATGHRGGHDLHYRVLQRIGVTLVGHFLGADDGRGYFASDLAESVAFGDAQYAKTRENIAKTCVARGIPVPEMPDPAPFDARAPESVDLAGFGAVVFTSGFRPDYSSWVHFDAFDQMGFPIQEDGASTVVPGLYFCGVHFLRKRKSSLLIGVGEDASIVAQKIAASPT